MVIISWFLCFCWWLLPCERILLLWLLMKSNNEVKISTILCRSSGTKPAIIRALIIWHVTTVYSAWKSIKHRFCMCLSTQYSHDHKKRKIFFGCDCPDCIALYLDFSLTRCAVSLIFSSQFVLPDIICSSIYIFGNFFAFFRRNLSCQTSPSVPIFIFGIKY